MSNLKTVLGCLWLLIVKKTSNYRYKFIKIGVGSAEMYAVLFLLTCQEGLAGSASTDVYLGWPAARIIGQEQPQNAMLDNIPISISQEPKPLGADYLFR